MPAPSTPLAQALLLAAGRGNRMRPLTDHTPKPLLQVHGKPLIEWPMRALAAQGFTKVLINTGWLGAQLPACFDHYREHGDGLPATHLQYSREEVDFGGALETAGGIARALPQLDDTFWLAAGDVYMPDFVFAQDAYQRFAASTALAHIWLVPNPTHNAKGDFALTPDGRVHDTPPDHADLPRYTYSTIGLFKKALFAEPYCNIPAGNPQGAIAPLAPVLRAAMRAGRVTGELYTGRWTDVGTPERLAALNQP
ncbi:MAG: nucleotidyltransferase family protein [Brachymonas sp.]|nr:nucleotidyltransferase family protein [Brachymonas sp.]